MPLYEYKCHGCGKTFEVIQKFSDEPLKTHPECGGEVERLISLSSVQFKGSGWYVTDYAKGNGGPKGDGKSEGKSDGKSEGKSEAKPDSQSGAGDKKSDSKPSGESKTSTSAESKPASKSSSTPDSK